MTDYPRRLRACVTASRGIDCRDPDFLLGAADEIDWLKAENTRLNDAKRRALVIADERSRENVALRATLKPFADYADPRHVVPASYVVTSGSQIAKKQLIMGDFYAAARALEQKADEAK